MTDLTKHEVAVLAFAKQRWNHAGARDTAIRDLFGFGTLRFEQELNGLLDREEAYVHDPVLIKRLRRQRDDRRRLRQRAG